MKKDITNKAIEILGAEIAQENVNKIVKAVIINFGDERGDIIVSNDNFGTRRKYADFTKGKAEAGLNPMQIVFSGFDAERTLDGRYINGNDEICYFRDI